MPGWAFSLLIGAFVALILVALVLEFIGERRTARDRPIDPKPPVVGSRCR
jgi:hypothetical protein